MDALEKRKNARVPISLDLLCEKVGSTGRLLHKGRVLNASPGGLYFEAAGRDFKPGDLAEMKLVIPPKQGLLEMGGAIHAMARILRVESAGSPSPDFCGIAVEFCRRPRLSV
ncbi:MAG: PilZ domain-containing protein [Sedimentisphaerales bacterium]|nr:PilZ domain-containing protein [Sedimentisphaerales bacterium]